MSLQQLDSKQVNRLNHLAVIASVLLSSALSLLKLFAALYTGSLAVLSSLIDSLSDVFSSLISFAAVKVSTQPASQKHRYGYGKAEALSAFFQSLFVAASGIYVIYEGVKRFIDPPESIETGLGIVVMCISLAATVILIMFQKYVVRKTNSLAVSADSLHYVVDVATNSSIILSLVSVKLFDIYWFDTLAAVFVSGYLLWNAYKLACDAISMLLDRELDHGIREDIESMVKKCDLVKGIHDLRTRDLGGTYIFEFHLELDGNLSLYKAHEFTDKVEHKIKEKYPSAQVIIHQDPAGVKEERLDDILV
jgi:ferrous-iron efflux pump FieF